MKHYILKQAEKEVGKSKSYAVALKVSIKKWKEIAKYGQKFYRTGEHCGYCLVEENREFYSSCWHCPVRNICRLVICNMTEFQAKEVLRKLQERQRKNKRRNERRRK